MFAKLVTNINTPFFPNAPSANVFFNTLINVISGAITSNTQLDPLTFNTSASYITNTVPSGWSVIDSQANTPGMPPVLSGCNPVVLGAPWTDSASNAKYVWVGAVNSVNTTFNVSCLPMEGWNTVTKAAGNNWFGSANNQVANIQSNYFNNSSNGFSRPYDFVSPLANNKISTGTVTIVSCSQAHLLVASYYNLTNPTFNNYFFLSEYTRDDPWNIVTNGYPAWLWEGAANTSGIFNANTFTTNGHFGAIATLYNPSLNTNSAQSNNLMSAVPNSFAPTTGNWGLTSRYINWGQVGSTAEGLARPFLPRGLAAAGTSAFFTGNQVLNRDIAKNPAYSVAEIRLTPIMQDITNNTWNSNNIFIGGSLSSVNPYVYLFSSGYKSLDELNFGGFTYMNLILNTGVAGSSSASNILVRET